MGGFNWVPHIGNSLIQNVALSVLNVIAFILLSV